MNFREYLNEAVVKVDEKGIYKAINWKLNVYSVKDGTVEYNITDLDDEAEGPVKKVKLNKNNQFKYKKTLIDVSEYMRASQG